LTTPVKLVEFTVDDAEVWMPTNAERPVVVWMAPAVLSHAIKMAAQLCAALFLRQS
jgi:hypothetical protein